MASADAERAAQDRAATVAGQRDGGAEDHDEQDREHPRQGVEGARRCSAALRRSSDAKIVTLSRFLGSSTSSKNEMPRSSSSFFKHVDERLELQHDLAVLGLDRVGAVTLQHCDDARVGAPVDLLPERRELVRLDDLGRGGAHRLVGRGADRRRQCLGAGRAGGPSTFVSRSALSITAFERRFATAVCTAGSSTSGPTVETHWSVFEQRVVDPHAEHRQRHEEAPEHDQDTHQDAPPAGELRAEPRRPRRSSGGTAGCRCGVRWSVARHGVPSWVESRASLAHFVLGAAEPERCVDHRGGRDDAPEQVCPEQDRQRRADRAVGVGLALEHVGDPVHRDDVEDLAADGHHEGAGHELLPGARAAREPPRREQPEPERHRGRERRTRRSRGGARSWRSEPTSAATISERPW